MAIFNYTNTTKELLISIFKNKSLPLDKSLEYFKTMHPHPDTNIILKDTIGDMAYFIKDNLKIDNYDLNDNFNVKYKDGNCIIDYHSPVYQKPFIITIFNFTSIYTTIGVKCGNDTISNIEVFNIRDINALTINIIMEVFSEIIQSEYKNVYRKG